MTDATMNSMTCDLPASDPDDVSDYCCHDLRRINSIYCLNFKTVIVSNEGETFLIYRQRHITFIYRQQSLLSTSTWLVLSDAAHDYQSQDRRF